MEGRRVPGRPEYEFNDGFRRNGGPYLMKIIKGSITAPKGFLASGVKSGIKKNKLDLCLILSVVPAHAEGVFTKNTVKAAPLVLSAANLRNGCAEAIIANSGNANCLNGRNGMKRASRVAEDVSAPAWKAIEPEVGTST